MDSPRKTEWIQNLLNCIGSEVLPPFKHSLPHLFRFRNIILSGFEKPAIATRAQSLLLALTRRDALFDSKGYMQKTHSY